MKTVYTESVISSADIDALLERREQVRELCERVERDGRDLQILGARQPSDGGWGRSSRWNAADELKEWERNTWSKLLDDSGLRDFMDATAREQWRKQYDSNTFPPFTVDNVRNAFDAIAEQRGEMLARGVRELFTRLSREHKTNKANAFGGKVIIGHVCEVWGGNMKTIRSGGNSDLIDDLNRTLHVLRGLPVPDSKGSARQILGDACPGPEAVFPFFRVRLFYGAGTAHVIFNHEEDVRRVNAMLSISTGGLQVPDTRRR